MKPYSELAESYDYLLRHVDYQGWYDYIISIMKKYCTRTEFIVELGCGTGRFGAKFSNDGYSILGIDNSEEMLEVAKTRAYSNFSVMLADIADFSIDSKPDFIFCVHDTMNYFTGADELKNALANVRNNMSKDTIFLFDLTTEYNIRKNFDGKKSRYKKSDSLIEWDNTFDPDESIVRSTLNFKKKSAPVSTEVHVQKIYRPEEINAILKDTGFEIIDIFGDFTNDPPAANTVMRNHVVRRAD